MNLTKKGVDMKYYLYYLSGGLIMFFLVSFATSSYFSTPVVKKTWPDKEVVAIEVSGDTVSEELWDEYLESRYVLRWVSPEYPKEE